MENVEKILSLVFIGIGIVAYIITTILAIKRKKDSGEQVKAEDVIATIADNVLGLVKVAEKLFPQAGSGMEKLNYVLTETKTWCKDAGVIFDRTYWTNYVSSAVDLINIAKDGKTAAEEKDDKLD